MPFYQVVEIQKVSENKESQYSSNWVIEKMHTTDVFVDVGDDPKDLCKRLKSMKFIDSCDMRKVSVSSMDKDIIDIRGKKTFKPLCRLEIARWISH